MKLVIIFLAVISLASCSATSKNLAVTPIKINQNELNNYWQMADVGNFSMDLSRGLPSANGTVVIEYLIDSDGRVHEVKIISYTPNDDWNTFAKKQAKKYRFKPATRNTALQPVYVQQEITFLGTNTRERRSRKIG